jgi:hypothetical protein
MTTIPPSLWMAARRWLVIAGGFSVFFAAYFSPALLRDRLLAPGDGEIYYVPFFHLPITRLWSDLMLSGYPVVADIQSQLLYPIRWLSPTFNSLVVSAYVICALGMLGLVFRLTASRWAALFAALTVSMSGYMVGHLGHLTIVHASAWVPSILWALAALRRGSGSGAVAGGTVAVALCLLGGHPQASSAGLLLAAAFAAHEAGQLWRDAGLRAAVRYLAQSLAMVALGVALAAPTLQSTLTAAHESVRGAWTKADFGSFSQTLSTLRLAVFPNLFGADPNGPYGAYRGPWNLTELALYAGILPILLSSAALVGRRRDRSPWFWLGVASAGILLSLGTLTPLGDVVYRAPVFGQFRAQARFGYLFIIGIAVLGSYGLATLLARGLSRTMVRWQFVACVVFCIAALSTLLVVRTGQASLRSVSVGVPLVVMVCSLAALRRVLREPGPATAATLIAVLVLDLGSFGWFYEWRYVPTKTVLPSLTAEDARILDVMRKGPGRVLPLDAPQMVSNPLRPNINLRYGIPSAVGYGPLLSARYASLAGTDPTGGFGDRNLSIPLLDVLGVRWIAQAGDGSLKPQLLGTGCGAPGSTPGLRVTIPDNVVPEAIRLVTHMGCSEALATGTEVARIRASSGTGHALKAGVDTADWAYDDPAHHGTIAHSRAHVAETFDAGGVVPALWFETVQPADAELPLTPGATLEITVANTPALLKVKAVQVATADGRRVDLPMVSINSGSEDALSPARPLADGLTVRERSAFRGLAWGVCDTRIASDQETAALLHGGRGSDGRAFNPFFTALLPSWQLRPTCAARPRVDVLAHGAGRWLVRVQSQGSSIAVLSESYNDGWVASVDGESASILRVDGLIMGVPIPEGSHAVELRYRPTGFVRGIGAACAALAIILVLAFRAGRRQLANSKERS